MHIFFIDQMSDEDLISLYLFQEDCNRKVCSVKCIYPPVYLLTLPMQINLLKIEVCIIKG